jgi:hypothetical protein
MCGQCRTNVGDDKDYCPDHSGSKEAPVGDIFNLLSWSNSKSNNLATCPRKVWNATFGTWGGWPNGDGDDLSRILYPLKKLKGRHGWAGDLVHRACQYTLERYVAGDQPTAEQVALQFIRVARYEFKNDRDNEVPNLAKWEIRKLKANQAHPVRMIEHRYGIKVSQAEWKKVMGKIETCIDHFFKSEIFSQLVSAKTQPWGDEEWLSTEELELIELDGVRVFIMADHVWRMEDGRIEVDDWKTGRPKMTDNEQMALYGVWAHRKWGVPIDQVQGRLVYLQTGEERVIRCSEESVEMVRARLAADVEDMKARGLQIDPETNHCTAPMERWPMTTDERECGWCEYQGPCERGNR